MSTSPTCIVAYTGEGEDLAAVRKAAFETAKTSNARLILYDIETASPFAKPLPTNWSAEPGEDQAPSRLGIADLERAGREDVARYLQEAFDLGIEAYAWLAGDKGGDSLAEYAHQQNADLIMLPKDMEDPGMIDKLRNATLEDVEEHIDRPIAIVDSSGDVEMTQ